MYEEVINIRINEVEELTVTLEDEQTRNVALGDADVVRLRSEYEQRIADIRSNERKLNTKLDELTKELTAEKAGGDGGSVEGLAGAVQCLTISCCN